MKRKKNEKEIARCPNVARRRPNDNAQIFRVRQTQQVKLHFYYLERMTCDIRGAVISPSFTISTAYCKVDDFLSRLVISIHSASDLMAGKFSATTTIIVGSRTFGDYFKSAFYIDRMKFIARQADLWNDKCRK